ncbi:AbrB family transcriptional regulator [Agrobacterium vitis]|uniref:AbrB family transcriptional regulator n=1 Tax=Agrobacterium vitis TaxID=373 RepID=UPI0012E72A4C|nr:AbrB family transcriptional regulator [Agrobacterium vitis]MVA23849.1 hypothetical protein [Agrobacterium vitis]
MVTFISTAVVASLGGYLLSLFHVPLAWMIGAMIASSILAWFRPAALPKRTRPVALMILGASFGLGFTKPVFLAVVSALPAIALAGLLTILAGLAIARMFSMVARVDMKTGYFCAVPGGVTVMPVLAEKAGAYVPAVTLAQTIRMVVVVLTFPPLMLLINDPSSRSIFHAESLPVYLPGLVLILICGLVSALVLQVFRIANPWMLGPLFFSMAITALWHAPSGFPHWLINAAQIGMGASLGVKLTGKFLLGSKRLAFASVISSFALAALLAALALGVAYLSGLPKEAVILGMAPGGTPEMVVTAAALNVAVPLVLGFHLVRMLISNLLIGPIWHIAEMAGMAGRDIAKPDSETGKL